jgi:hypothetical protein
VTVTKTLLALVVVFTAGSAVAQDRFILTPLDPNDHHTYELAPSDRCNSCSRRALAEPSIQCTVADPTGTPLHVHVQPNIRSTLIDTLDNGVVVDVYDRSGKWVFVRAYTPAARGPVTFIRAGWTWEPYLANCKHF